MVQFSFFGQRRKRGKAFRRLRAFLEALRVMASNYSLPTATLRALAHAGRETFFVSDDSQRHEQRGLHQDVDACRGLLSRAALSDTRCGGGLGALRFQPLSATLPFF
jgi:hypothetical protein